MLSWFDSLAHYRSQPELEGFEDFEIEHLVEQARGRREDALWVLPLATIAAMWLFVMMPVILLARTFLQPRPVAAVQGAAAATGGGGASVTKTLEYGPFIAFGVIAITVILLLAATVFVWIWQRRLLIVRSIRRITNKASCPFCDFNLRGLPVTDNRLVRCPECGESIILEDLGLTKRDLMIDDGHRPNPISPLAPDSLPDVRAIPLEDAPPRARSAPDQAARGRNGSRASPPPGNG